ncbi:DUF748 domain-containing protein [Litorivivens sp.]|uniref:DUF748 domain-containing protein n=1 Tax=Litorivivens sp. TaxID=2020868 RepID=UPI003569F2FA
MTTTKALPRSTSFYVILRRVVLIVGLILLSVCLAVWAFSPTLARWQVNRVLSPYDVQLSDDSVIRLNPFILKLSVQDVKLLASQTGKDLARIDSGFVDVDASSLFSKELKFEGFSMTGFSVLASRSASDITMAGFSMSAQQAETDESAAGVRAAAMPEVSPTSSADSLDGSIKIAPVDNSAAAESEKLDLPKESIWRVNAKKIEFDDISIAIDNIGVRHQLTIESLIVSAVAIDQHSQSFTVSLSAVVDGAPLSMVASLGAKSRAGQLEIDFSMNNYPLSRVGYLLGEYVSDVSGSVDVNIRQHIDFDEASILLDVPELKVQFSNLAAVGKGVALDSEELTAIINSGRLEIREDSAPEVDAQFSVGGKLTRISSENRRDTLLQYASLDIADGKLAFVDFPEVAIGKTVVDKLLVSEKGGAPDSGDDKKKAMQAIAAIDKVSVIKLDFKDGHMAVDTMRFDGLDGSVHLDSDKKPSNLVALEQPATKDTGAIEGIKTVELEQPADSPVEERNAPLTYSINQLAVSDGSHFNFSDSSVKPVFRQKIEFTKFEVSQLDSRHPDRKMTFDIQVKTDKYASTKIVGSMQPFAEKVNFQANANVREYSLPKVSPYLKKALGFEMLSGQFDTKIKLEIVDNIIDGESKLSIRGLKLSSKDAAQPNLLKDQGAMPLNSALGMLMDDKGNFKLKVPLTGDIEKPGFGPASFIALVSKKAIMSSAQSYLVETFVPYANVLSVVMMAGEYMLKVKFQDLIYSPGAIENLPEHKTFIDEFTRLLKDKPDTQVKVCAVATVADLARADSGISDEAYVEELKVISEARGESFKSLVMESGGVESSRLLLCQPQVDLSKGAKPRIEFET